MPFLTADDQLKSIGLGGGGDQTAPGYVDERDLIAAIQQMNPLMRWSQGESIPEAIAGGVGAQFGVLKQVPGAVGDVLRNIGQAYTPDPKALRAFDIAAGSVPAPVQAPVKATSASPAAPPSAAPVVPPQESVAPPTTPEPSKPSGGISAYQKDNKVFFTNQKPPDGATSIDYEAAVRGVGGTPGGNLSIAQEQPEVATAKQLRDTMLSRMLAEASLTPEQKFQRELGFERQKAEAGTAQKLAEITKLAETLKGAKVVPGHPEFELLKEGIFKQIKQQNPKLDDAAAWTQAYTLAQNATEADFQKKVLSTYLIQNRMTSEPMTYADMLGGAPNAQ